jgi:hypothetical protein
MKKLLLFASIIAVVSCMPADSSISKKEKKAAATFLKETRNGVLDAVKGPSETQLAFNPAPDKWSVQNCLKHIAATETGLWQLTEGNIQQATNP